MRALAVGFLVVGLTAGASVPITAAGEIGLEFGRLYKGKSDGLVLELVALEPVDDETSVLVRLDGVCGDDWQVDDSFVTTVDTRGRFDLHGRTEGSGTDDRWRIRGTFAGEKVSGRVEAALSSSDEEGSDSCEIEERDWKAKAGKPKPGLERLEAAVEITKAPHAEIIGTRVVAGPNAVYVTEHSFERLIKIDPAANEVAWTAEGVLDPESVVETDDAVFALGTADNDENVVVRLDPATGEEQTRATIGPFFTATVTATDDAVWVGGEEEPGSNRGTVVRLDPSTLEVTATLEIEGFEPSEVAAGAHGVYAFGIRRDSETSTSGGGGIARIDPATAEIAAQGEIESADQEIVVGGDGLFVVGLVEPFQRLDPVTLEATGRAKGDVYGITAAPPGVWGVTGRAIAAYDAGTLEVVATIPVELGEYDLAGGFGSVWLLDPRLGTVVRVRAGA